MQKELFIKSIEAIQRQSEYDIAVAENLGKAFPESHTANLLPKNHFLQNALLEILQVQMNDNNANSWIEYFLWDLDFGRENYRLKVTQDDKEIPLSTPGELYDFLVNQK